MKEYLSKIRWLVADWHFGERRLDMMFRPFRSTEEHSRALIDNHNCRVKPDDVVLCVGDVTSIDAPHCLPLVGQLNGTKILIRGNHDEPHSDSDLRSLSTPSQITMIEMFGQLTRRSMPPIATSADRRLAIFRTRLSPNRGFTRQPAP
jgi:calcineurin-like phosphoesterase family protein